MNVTAQIIAALLGVAAGLFIIPLSEKVAAYKLSFKHEELKESAFFSAWTVLIAFALLNGAVWYLLARCFVSWPSLILACVIGFLAITVAIIDARIHIIPNEAVIILAVLGLALQTLLFGFKKGLLFSFLTMLGAMLVFITIGLIIGLSKVGAGDVKLAGAMGAVLGLSGIAAGLAVMAVTILAFILIGLLVNKINLKTMFPYAPFLSAGIVCGMVYMCYNVTR